MKKSLKMMLLLALAVGSFSIYSEAQATKHVLQGTYISNGNYNGDVSGATYTAISPQLIVDCPGTGTCTIEADMWVQNSRGTDRLRIPYASTWTAFNLVVAPTPGGATTAGYFETLSSSWPVSGLAAGEHTVQTYVYSTDGEFVGYYTVNYRVYKP